MMEKSRSNFNSTYMNPSKTLLYELDNDYSKLTPHKKIHLDQVYNISLFTYSEQFYNLQMANYIFPMRVIVKNVKNQGTIYIGYDQEYPGVYHNHQIPIFSIENLEKIKNYDFKLAIKQDLVILLKKKGKQVVKNIYFTIIAGKSLFLCDFKVQFLGLKDSRAQSEPKFKKAQKSYRIKEKDNIYPSIPMMPKIKTQQSDSGKNLKKFVHSKISSRQNMNKTTNLQQLNVFNKDQVHKYYSKPNNEQKAFKRTNKNAIDLFKTFEMLKNDKKRSKSTGSFNMIKQAPKAEVDYKIQQAKRNKEMLEQYKLKDKELRATASKCKKMIEDYKKFFNQQNLRKSKLNKDLVLSLYSAIFIKNIHRIVDYQIRKQKMVYKINYWCTKFVKKLKKAYKNSCNLLPYRAKRITSEGSSGVYLLSKMISKQSTLKAQKILNQTLVYLKPLFLMHRSFTLSNRYRHKIILIQRTWKTKYHNRLQALMYFVDNYLLKMFSQLAHLKMFSEMFYASKSNRDLCLNYISNQSERYRQIYQLQTQKLSQRNERDASLPTKNQVSSLHSSNRSAHRFFRNIDKLKFMVRSWFQHEYKKFLKKSAKKINY